VSEGSTYENALKNIRIIMGEWIETARKEGRTIPKPKGWRLVLEARFHTYKEPKSLLEIRAWKRKVSSEMNRLGIEEYNKRAEVRTRDLRERIEKRRKEKLTGNTRRYTYDGDFR
jgi:hypothetical protein